MSSKVGQNQQQGRRTPLSLTGGSKQAQQQQQQQHKKANSNLATTQEQLKSDATVATKNGNSNGAKNQELNNLKQKDTKKSAQQNGNGNGTGSDIVIDLTDNAKNGTANGHKNNKNNAPKAEAIKEKDNKETENNKEKPKKSDTAKQQTEEKKQNEAVEQPAEQLPATTNATKSKDNTPAKSNTPTIEKKQTAAASKANANGQKPATPTKAIEKGTATPPTKSPAASKSGTPSKSPRGAAAGAKNANSSDVAVTADVEMLPLLVEPSPQKKAAVIKPAATSTPGKVSEKRSGRSAKDETEVINKDSNSGSPEQSNIPRVFSQISGRRSIRPLESFTPNKYNSQFRESYRRINTELDVTGTTNTSMNVTVGSEIPNNSSFLSFSLFGRGRKRERTPPSSTMPTKSQSAVELTTETTPPKRPRLDVNVIFTAMSSPLTLLRSRFSKTTLESSTPAKLKESDVAAGEDDVQNVSGVSIEEVVCNSNNSAEIDEAQHDITVGKEAIPETTPNKKTSPMKKKKAGKDIEEPATADKANESKEAPAMDVDSDIQMKETPIIAAVGDPKAKQRGCTVM